MTSSDRPIASDSTISTASCVPATDEVEFRLALDLAGGRIEKVLAVLVADARSADRRGERNARQRDGGGRADQRRYVGVDLRVERQNRRDDLDFVVEAFGKKRPQRPVDQAGGQRLLLGGPAFTLEESARDLARGVRLLDVVDGQREEVTAGNRFAAPDCGDKDHRVAHRDDGRAVRLAGEAPGLDRDRVRAIRKSLPGNGQCGSL